MHTTQQPCTGPPGSAACARPPASEVAVCLLPLHLSPSLEAARPPLPLPSLAVALSSLGESEELGESLIAAASLTASFGHRSSPSTLSDIYLLVSHCALRASLCRKAFRTLYLVFSLIH